MKRGSEARPLGAGRRLLGAALILVPLDAAAQIGPLSTQSLFFNQAADAQRGNYLAADTGLVYSDNVTRTQQGSSDTLALLGLVGDASRQGPRLDYRLATDLSLVKYLHSGYQTQPFGYLDGRGDLWVLPGTFAWTGRETYTQTVIDPFAPVTPDNLEGINYASTGPRFTLRPTLSTTLTLNGTYSYLNSSSKSPFAVGLDNHRYAGEGTLDHAFSSASSAYVTARTEKVDFRDQTFNTNFREDRGLVGYKLASARTVLDLGAGYSRLHAGGTRPSGTLWRIALSRLTSPSSRLSVFAHQEVTDAASLFRLNLDQPVAGTAAYRLTTSDPFTDREVGANWRFQAGRTSFTLGYLDFRERYKLHPGLDRNVKDGTAFVTRQLSPLLRWDIGAEYERQAFAGLGSSNTVNAITSLRWRLAPQLAVRFLYGHSALTPHGYAENQAGVTASYTFFEEAPGDAQGTLPGSVPPHPP